MSRIGDRLAELIGEVVDDSVEESTKFGEFEQRLDELRDKVDELDNKVDEDYVTGEIESLTAEMQLSLDKCADADDFEHLAQKVVDLERIVRDGEAFQEIKVRLSKIEDMIGGRGLADEMISLFAPAIIALGKKLELHMDDARKQSRNGSARDIQTDVHPA